VNHGDTDVERKLPLRRDCLHGRGRSRGRDDLQLLDLLAARRGLGLRAQGEVQALTKGEGKLGDYQFNKHVLHHQFCPSCGIESYAEGKGPDGSEMVGINLRCVEGVDVAKLSPKQVDGRSR
jgi:hypothetical protein